MTAVIIKFVLSLLLYTTGYLVMSFENIPLWKQYLIGFAFVIGTRIF